MKVAEKTSAGLQCIQGNSRRNRRMAQPDFMDFLILDELVSEEENEARRRQREECEFAPDDDGDDRATSWNSDYDEWLLTHGFFPRFPCVWCTGNIESDGNLPESFSAATHLPSAGTGFRLPKSSGERFSEQGVNANGTRGSFFSPAIPLLLKWNSRNKTDFFNSA